MLKNKRKQEKDIWYYILKNTKHKLSRKKEQVLENNKNDVPEISKTIFKNNFQKHNRNKSLSIEQYHPTIFRRKKLYVIIDDDRNNLHHKYL